MLVAGLLVAACTDEQSDTNPTGPAAKGTTTTAAAPGYEARIVRTEYGVPHITADDWGSLGFGQGYAFAQDRACTLIDQVIKVRGERSKWFGAGDGDANLTSDFAYRHLHLWDDADEKFADQPDEIRDMVAGYVAGFNQELDDEGPHGWCEGEPWVGPITTADFYANINDALLFASSGVLIDPIGTAAPPDPAAPDTSTTATGTADTTAASPGRLGVPASLGSNGWAIGAAASETGGGMLLANPHFPWEGEKRLWENQLTLTTGELDVYGVTLTGTPGVLIGFNDHVAWTHTVSAGYRMTLYELTLDPSSPTTYVYGGETREMTSEEITVEVKGGGTQTRTMWSSHYGPMLNLPFGWTTEKAYTLRDANIDNTAILQQFLGMDRATSMDELIDAHRTFNGIPWVNTMAASADGRAWYADTSATPNLSADAIAGWQAAVAAGGLAAVALDSGAVLLDGSDPVNEWVDDPEATRPGILPFSQQPQLERDDWVFNANDSHWLANPAELLTGFSPLTGAEAVPQSPRTRENAVLLADPAVRGDDGLLSLADVQAAWYSGRALLSDQLRDAVVAACEDQKVVLVEGKPFDILPACAVLRAWDGRLNPDSRGAVLWREFVWAFGSAARADAGDLWAVPFDPADPVGTPNTLADNTTVVNNIAVAMMSLQSQGWPLDIALGDVQFDGRPVPDQLPLPGGQEFEGAVSIVDCCSGSNTLQPTGDVGTPVESRSYRTKGYPVTYGNSFVMTLAFTPEGPRAEAVLTYGQPDDLTGPEATAQTVLFSAKQFRPILFTPAEVEAGAVSDSVVVGVLAG